MSEASAGPARLGYSSILRPRMGVNVPRIDEAILDRFRNTGVSDISDLVGRMYTMDIGIKPMYSPMARLVGQALTAKAAPGDNFPIHGALGLTQPGDVLVVDWHGYMEGCGAGGMACKVPVSKGLAGIVIDGTWRDIAEVSELKLPLFARGVSPFSPMKSDVGEINVPISCGHVIVEPGDVIIGDAQGIVVIPRREAKHVADSLKGHDVGVKAGTLAGLYKNHFDARSGEVIDLSSS